MDEILGREILATLFLVGVGSALYTGWRDKFLWRMLPFAFSMGWMGVLYYRLAQLSGAGEEIDQLVPHFHWGLMVFVVLVIFQIWFTHLGKRSLRKLLRDNGE